MKSKMKAVLMGIRLPAVEADQLEPSLTCLAAHGAEVHALDPRNRLALSWARAKHREEVVKLLREGRGFPLVPWYALLWRERFEQTVWYRGPTTTAF